MLLLLPESEKLLLQELRAKKKFANLMEFFQQTITSSLMPILVNLQKQNNSKERVQDYHLRNC